MLPAGGRSVQCLFAGRFEVQGGKAGFWVWRGRTGKAAKGTKRTVLIGATRRLVPWVREGMGAEEGWVGLVSEVEIGFVGWRWGGGEQMSGRKPAPGTLSLKRASETCEP